MVRSKTLRLAFLLRLVAVATVCGLAVTGAAGAAAGGLDPSFGTGGEAITSIPGSAAGVVIEQNDRAVAVAGTTLAGFRDGHLDPSFGSGGTAPLAHPARSLALQPDGRIVVGGDFPVPPPLYLGFALERLDADGHPDPTFGTGGVVLTDSGVASSVQAVVVAPDSTILAGGGTSVARYTPSGTLDSSFGQDGIASVPINSCVYITSIAIAPDGKVVVGCGLSLISIGTSTVVRLTRSGALDPGFGTVGVATINAEATAGYSGVTSVLVQPDGKVLACGPARDYHFGIFRFDVHGRPDTTFGFLHTGRIVTTFTGLDLVSSLALQLDGKIVAAGTTELIGGESHLGFDLAVARYTANGALDPSFGSGGKVVTDLGNHTDDSANAVAVQLNGRIVVAGGLDAGGGAHVALVRYLGS